MQPEPMEFLPSVNIDISAMDIEKALEAYPQPYYELTEDKAYPVYGNYLLDAFRLKQNGVLRARGDFQTQL